MARKKRTLVPAPSLPLSKGEIWEVGRRALEVSVADLARKGERPEVLLVVQAGEAGGVVLGDAITSRAPHTVLADIVVRAMREPLIGKPRRPEVIRVGSPAEAELLATSPAITGVALEVAGKLVALERFQSHMELQLGGLSSDYRTQAARAGETLSAESLHTFFHTARQFYREAMWEAYSDGVMFELTLQAAQGAGKTLYGIIIGALGEEFGLALYPSLEELQQFYNASLEHLDQFAGPPQPATKKRPDTAQLRREAEAMVDLLQVSTLCLTYTSQQDVPPPLVEEAKQLKLPLAHKSAFPFVMRTGQGGMRAATARELADMYVALSAILDWDNRIDDVAGEDEVDITITSQIPAVPEFLPELTVHTTLRENPYLPEEDEEDALLPDLSALFESFLSEPPRRQPASQKKPAGKAGSQKSSARVKQPSVPTTNSNRVYTLEVYLADGPLSSAYANRTISRRLELLGRQTLHDLHQAIFEAFERWEQHLYEFNLGEGPADRSQRYFYTGGLDADDEEAGDPTTTTLDALNLEVGRHFGYIFDMGDQWEHVIEVVAIAEARGKGKYPRLAKKVGKAPPQYPDDDDEDA
jgi:Plasmid pRiA4b ORF-3-like protein